MALLSEEDQKFLKGRFQDMNRDVRVLVFTSENDCMFCDDTKAIINELAGLESRIKPEFYDIDKDKETAEEYGITLAPSIAIVGEKDYGIRYWGIPSGYEFSSLFEDIIDASTGRTDLSQETIQRLRELNTDLTVYVFVTPSCPYCPIAVRMAHKMAIESDHITGIMVEAQEFLELSQKYAVMAVPKMVVNDKIEFEGALPEEQFVKQVLQAAD